MTTFPAPMCLMCKHFRHEVKDSPQCAAFPKRIPRYIFDRQRRLHIRPLKGDHGIQFELMSDEEQIVAFGQALPLSDEHQQAYNRLAPNRDVLVSEMPSPRVNGG